MAGTDGRTPIQGNGITSRGGRARRVGRIGATAVRRGTPLLIHRLRRSNGSAAPLYDALGAGCQDLGATFTKLGQLVASAPGLVGDEMATAFRPLLDNGPEVSFPDVRRRVEADLGSSLRHHFSEFEAAPLAAASLAVVHRAVTTDGRPVAVKVLRPGVEQLVATDLALVQPMVGQIAAASDVRIAYIMQGLIEGLAEQLDEELDLRRELAVMQSMRTLLDELSIDQVVVPEPLPELSGRHVLTMELLDGVAIDDEEALERLGSDVRGMVEALVRAWFLGVIRHGVFHGDVHAGNLMLLRDGRVGVVDWGIVGRLSPQTHFMFRRMLQGVLGDESAWEDVARDIVERFIPADHPLASSVRLEDVAQLNRERAHAFLNRPFGEVSLAEVLEGPPLPPELINDEWPPVHVLAGRWVSDRLHLPNKRMPPALPDFDRGMFLLVKQLVYFERYGRRHMADRALFDDAELHRAALALTSP